MRFLTLGFFVLLAGFIPAAELRFAGIFGDHMVLQADQANTVWGWGAEPDATVEFSVSTAKAETKANAEGAWRVNLPAMAAQPLPAEGKQLVVRSGTQEASCKDVLVGEVWHASGQSNMGWTTGSMARRLPQAKADIEAADFPALRWIQLRQGDAKSPAVDIKRQAWTRCSPATASRVSGTAFYFARRIQAELHVPVGIIDSSRGGTPIEPFIPKAAFTGHPTLEREAELGEADDLAGIWRLPGGVRARSKLWLPGRLYNTRLHPVRELRVRGAIWYQGESNCGDREDPRDYQHKMRALVEGWRTAFNHPNMPFYFVQLPGSGARSGWPYLREQQRLAANSLAHSGLAVTIDLLDKDIHPPNKVDVGERLARWALARTYDRAGVRPSGPWYRKATVTNDTLTVHFDFAENGMILAAKKGLDAPLALSAETTLAHVELAGKDRQWHPAVARVDGKALNVISEKVPQPVAVRYAYANDPQHCALYNRTADGLPDLPATPFCSHPDWLVHDPGLPTD